MIRLLTVLLLLSSFSGEALEQTKWALHTSSVDQERELQRLFSRHGCKVSMTGFDIKEIDADALTVVIHKASQIPEETLIEKSSLEIDGAERGVSHLNEYVGHRAKWQVYLAYRVSDKVFIFQGTVHGTIVEPQGHNGFSFERCFLPDGAGLTLGQSKPDQVNARAMAVEALMSEQPSAVAAVIRSF
jgi:XTP/dITP diphosphohydrolase